MIRWWLLGAGVTVCVVLIPVIAIVGLASNANSSASAATCQPGTTVTPTGVTKEQAANATVIVATGNDLHIPERGLVIAIATAEQESKLVNLPGGDRDSVGLFQQRPSQGWGTPAELHTPSIAATKFYKALLKVHGWETLPLTVAAQAVQGSGLPDAYAQWEPMATNLVRQLGGAVTCDPVSVVTGTAAQEAAAILKQWGTRIVGNADPKQDLEDTAHGHPWDRCGHQVTLDPDLLHLYLLAMQRFKITVWSFSRGHGDGCEPFYHPPGMASDIGAVTDLATGQTTNFYSGQAGNNPAVVVAFVDFLADHGPSGVAIGQSECADHAGADANYRRVGFSDSCTHTHVNVHENDPVWGPWTKETWPK